MGYGCSWESLGAADALQRGLGVVFVDLNSNGVEKEKMVMELMVYSNLAGIANDLNTISTHGHCKENKEGHLA